MSRAFASASSQYLRRESKFTTYNYDGSYNANQRRTFSCWLNVSSFSTNHHIMVDGFDYFGFNGYFLAANSDATLKLSRYRNSSQDYAVSAPGTISTGVWHHAAATFSPYFLGDTGTAYLNGAAGSSGQNTNSLGDDSIGSNHRSWIGASLWAGAYMDGSIAEAAVWTATLTDAEIGILAKGVSPLLVRPGSLALYVPLVRDSDIDVISGLSYTPYNTPTVSNHPRVLYPINQHVGVYVAAAASGIAPKAMHYKRLRR